ncbi:unnamed protein product [Protopolystoma xenopodis]|uniref:Uncharacterized protein n=1 Tax=Protopolystoma xenopodis TaxID=117903 RepID=A0A3S5FGQ5_9PLAT|nr:unnamed protein product [Protopolystoma xenopodis]
MLVNSSEGQGGGRSAMTTCDLVQSPQPRNTLHPPSPALPVAQASVHAASITEQSDLLTVKANCGSRMEVCNKLGHLPPDTHMLVSDQLSVF